MHVQACLSLVKAHAHCDCCEAMHACACFVCGTNKVYAHCDCCEATHACACLCVLVHKAHGHCDCCEAMHACVGVCVLLFTRRMVTVISARRCMRVLECVFALDEAYGHCDCCKAMHVCMNMYECMIKAYGHGDCCEAMHACVRVRVWGYKRRMLTLLCARHTVSICLVQTTTCMLTHEFFFLGVGFHRSLVPLF